MIDFYSWKTPNGFKVGIALEELKLPYKLHPIDISQDQQFDPKYLKINPNNKIPAIVDQEGPNKRPITLFESGAILIYLAEKTGKLISNDPELRMKAIQWLMFQMGGIGPMFGQLNHFLRAAPEQIPYAIQRYSNEVKRLYRVMDHHLSEHSYFADDYSIADIAIFTWVNIYERQNIRLSDFPAVERWFKAIQARPAVQKGITFPE